MINKYITGTQSSELNAPQHSEDVNCALTLDTDSHVILKWRYRTRIAKVIPVHVLNHIRKAVCYGT